MTKRANHRIADADIAQAQAISIAVVARERGIVLKRSGRELVGPCPHCGGRDRFAVNVTNLFNCRGCGAGGKGAISFIRWLDGLKFPEAVEALTGRAVVRGNPGLPGTRTAPRTSADYDRRQREKALWLWSQKLPIAGSIAEVYLRERGITCSLPPTLAFLPARKPEHHPAMISAFGLCGEVVAVHLTLLRPDGSGKADVEKNKIFVGSPVVVVEEREIGRPIVIAPPNDLLALAITEGVEDALSVHQATGLGAWAAGSAPHMAKLGDAVPDWIDCVSIFADADADHQGERNALRLAGRLRERGIETITEGLDA